MKRFAIDAMAMKDAVPDLLRGFGEPEQVAVLRVDSAFVDQKLHVGRTISLF